MSSTIPSFTERLQRTAAGPIVRNWLSVAKEQRWRSTGSPAPAPPHWKAATVQAYARRFAPATFIETGTYRGDMVAAVAPMVPAVITIELDPGLCAFARARFIDVPNVRVVEGDSALLLPGIVERLDAPALFWLDGHYSAGSSAGLGGCPLMAELMAVFTSPLDHVVLIDDARLLDGTDHYPTIAEVRQLVGALRPDMVWELEDDIIRLYVER